MTSLERVWRFVNIVAMLGVFLGIPLSGICADYTYINIKNPFIRKIPVAIPDFKPLTQTGTETVDGAAARKIMEDALNFTGYLTAVDNALIKDASLAAGITRADIHFPDWTVTGAELLVTGGVTAQNGIISLQLRLFDTFKERLLVGKIYTGQRTDLRKMVHRFCGEISLFLTGKRGIFNSRIAFVSTVQGGKEIFACDFDGYNPEQVTHLNSITLSPAWSSDGQWLAYTSYVRGAPAIYVKNLKEKRGAMIEFKGLNITPDWHPGQFSLAACLSFSGDQEIYLLTGKGKVIKRITNSRGIDVSPDFSPDGKKITFVSRRSGTPQIYVQDIETGDVRRITYEGRYNTSPAWSPDGGTIAYVGSVDGQINIYLIGADGSSPRQLTSDAGDNEDPSWSPDGSLIAFSSTRQGDAKVFIMTAAGGEQRPLLTMKGQQTHPDWSLVTDDN